MFYKKIKPAPLLQPYVSTYYLWEGQCAPNKSFEITRPANTNFAMVFNYGDDYQLFNGHYQGQILPRVFLAGPSTQPYTLRLTGSFRMVGIIFRSSAVFSLFRLPAPRELLNTRIPLEDLLGQEVTELNEQLALAPSNMARIHLLDAFILKRLTHAQPLNKADLAANLIIDCRGILRMDELSEALNLSSRQLRRIFKERTGLNPKLYARLKRFNYINLRLTNNKQLSWQHFLDDGLFYDQSHFIKDYQSFFGEKPSNQILQNRELAAQIQQ